MVKNKTLLLLLSFYLIQNDLSKATEVLHQISETYILKYFSNQVKLSYTISKCKYNIATKRFDNAHILLSEVKTLLDSEANRTSKDIKYDSYFSLKYCLNIKEKDDYYGAILFYSQLLDKLFSTFAKVKNSTYLGRVYLHNGEIEKSQKAFSFVSVNGGNSYYAKAAE